jgi:[histone H3]-lysine36 N-dimethyltransferase SETMAR
VKIGCPWSIVQDHLHRLGKNYKQGISVPHELSLDQWYTIYASILSRYEDDKFLRRIITGDEKWVLYNNPERKKQ